LGISALAVSLRSGVSPAPWESAADLAVALLPVLAGAPASTVLNLNVPALPLHDILGLRWARVGGSGLIKAAAGNTGWDTPNRPEMEGPAAAEAARAIIEDGQAQQGEIVLSVGSPFPRSGEIGLADPDEDATLVAQGYAALTALQGPRASEDPGLFGLLDEGLAAALGPLGLAS
jgi:broad specificity polyphosphatase/5'/3'-nucleotidase SurE